MIYTIHRCLAELKTLDSRIDKSIRGLEIVGTKKGSSNKIIETLEKVDEFYISSKANYESVIKLISNRDKIKKAIVTSNANTHINVGGVEYTVAEAIERKSSIDYEKSLLSYMERQYNDALRDVNLNNEKMEDNLERQENTMRENGLSTEDIKLSTELYRKQNGWELVDPLNIKKKIKELDEYISVFETEIDHELSTSNAITTVEIDLD